MSYSHKILAVLVVLSCVGGCSSYHVVSFPQVGDEAVSSGSRDYPIEAGDNVRITEIDNTRVEGKVKSRDGDAITLEAQNFGYDPPDDVPPRVIEIPSIKTLEKKEASPNKTTFLIVGVLVGSIGLMAVGLALSGGVMD